LALAGCGDHIVAQPTCLFLCLTIIHDTNIDTVTPERPP
jgi:hypothetical protein